jgi:hypothetical protein
MQAPGSLRASTRRRSNREALRKLVWLDRLRDLISTKKGRRCGLLGSEGARRGESGRLDRYERELGLSMCLTQSCRESALAVLRPREFIG